MLKIHAISVAKGISSSCLVIHFAESLRNFVLSYDQNKADTRDELLVNILDVIACIKERQDALRRTTRYVFTRVAMCIDVDVGIFERLL